MARLLSVVRRWEYSGLANRIVVVLIVLVGLSGCGNGGKSSGGGASRQGEGIRLQLNWVHDPTFTGEYLAARSWDVLDIREGGPNMSPVSAVRSGQADVAIVGADIFLKSLGEAVDRGVKPSLICIFTDFQRNPVGWVLHPDVVGELLGSGVEAHDVDNDWLFEEIASGRIEVGDKRGTETTAVWLRWKQLRGLDRAVEVVPVGFDASVVLGAPKMAFPVYLNEEPYKLGERIGEEVVTFDPADDGVALYGNVIITTDTFLNQHRTLVRKLQRRLQRGWNTARDSLGVATDVVRQVYSNVSRRVLEAQINKTLSFVYYETDTAGVMDMDGDGRWVETLESLQRAGVVSKQLRFGDVRDHVFGVD